MHTNVGQKREAAVTQDIQAAIDTQFVQWAQQQRLQQAQLEVNRCKHDGTIVHWDGAQIDPRSLAGWEEAEIVSALAEGGITLNQLLGRTVL